MAKLCPQCGSPLHEHHYCEHCDKRIEIFEKLQHVSLAFFEKGFQRAAIRDLSGAISYLRRSISFDKNNVDARNLLGLVYFEMGEPALAIEQWTISHRTDQNPMAIDLLKRTRYKQGAVEKMDSVIKKYNQALQYAKQESFDLAIIQLKKVVSMNPGYIQALNLLALCYIMVNERGKAKKPLLQALAIDKTNYLASAYLAYLGGNHHNSLDLEEEEEVLQPKRASFDYSRFNLSGAVLQFVSIVAGVAIGVALSWFLIMPGRISAREDEIAELKEQTARLESAEEQYQTSIDALTQELEEAENTGGATAEEAETYKAAAAEMTRLLKAYQAVVAGNDDQAADLLYVLDESVLDAEAQAVSASLKEAVYPEVANKLYIDGYNRYAAASYEEAIQLLVKSLQLDEQGDPLYFLARSYQRSGDNTKAIEHFNAYLEKYPNGTRAADTRYFLNTLQ